MACDYLIDLHSATDALVEANRRDASCVCQSITAAPSISMANPPPKPYVLLPTVPPGAASIGQETLP